MEFKFEAQPSGAHGKLMMQMVLPTLTTDFTQVLVSQLRRNSLVMRFWFCSRFATIRRKTSAKRDTW